MKPYFCNLNIVMGPKKKDNLPGPLLLSQISPDTKYVSVIYAKFFRHSLMTNVYACFK